MSKKWIKRIKLLFMPLLILPLFPLLSFAAIPWDVLDSGGGGSSSSDYVLMASVSQTGAGESTGVNNTLKVGYLCKLLAAPPSPACVPIKPVFTSPQGAGAEFWVNIQIGDATNPVSDLFGVSFRLNYDTALLDVVTPYSVNVIPGAMLGSNVLFVLNVDDTAGHVDIGISRKAGQPGVSGYGLVAKIKFQIHPAATPTTTCFSISDEVAINPSGETINLCPQTECLTIVTLPAAPNLISPPDGVLAVVTALEYQWSTVSGCWYEFELDNNSDFSSPEHTGTTTSTTYNPGVYLPDDTYYWRVRAINSAGVMSAWSDVWSVKVTTVVLKPIVTSPQLAGTEFWVDIYATKTSNVVPTYYPLNDLFCLNFSLFFERTDILDMATPLSASVELGGFLGTNSLMIFSLNEDVGGGRGRIDIGITRKAGFGGVSGYGQIVRIKFAAASGTSATGIILQTSDVGYPILAYNSTGKAIHIGGAYSLLDITKPMEVWPGDTNNDGIVDTADIFPIAIYYNRTGPIRPNATLIWTGQPMPTPWTPVEATYADANGDGVVNSIDVIAIGINYSQTHSVSSSPSSSLAPAQINHALFLDAYRAMYKELKANGIEVPELEKALEKVIAQGVQIQQTQVPEESALLQNYPNPFNPECWIPYELNQKAHVVIRIYNLTGQLVRTLDEGVKEAGKYLTPDRAAYWNGRNDEGDEVASGVYFYQLQIDGKVLTKRMVVLK